MRFALAILCCASVARAEGHLYVPPEGCTAFMTLQTRDCQVEHYWTCAADPAGDQWRISMGALGPIMLSRTDYETQWMETYDLDPPYREEIVLPAADPASFSELLATGLDTFDFQQRGEAGVTRVTGYDRIAERDLVIDGEPLMRTDYSVRETDDSGRELYHAEGSEYISVKYRRFFSGYGKVVNREGVLNYDGSPVEFIYPGEPGFLSKTPKFGCGANLAAFPVQDKDAKP